MNQDNKQAMPVALVTGSARRIGASIIQTLHQAGFRVIIHCHHSLAEAKGLAHLLNNFNADTAFVIQYDLNKINAGEHIIKEAERHTARLDLLVNNASLFLRTDKEQWSKNDQKDLFTTNVFAPFDLSMAAYPLLARQRGSIINITDIHAEKPLKDYALYCQTKAALNMQTKALAREFSPLVRVNAIAPGAIMWPEKDNLLTQERRERIIAKTPLKSHGQPEYVAQALLALHQNPFITGQILNVDGGRSIL